MVTYAIKRRPCPVLWSRRQIIDCHCSGKEDCQTCQAPGATAPTGIEQYQCKCERAQEVARQHRTLQTGEQVYLIEQPVAEPCSVDEGLIARNRPGEHIRARHTRLGDNPPDPQMPPEIVRVGRGECNERRDERQRHQGVQVGKGGQYHSAGRSRNCGISRIHCYFATLLRHDCDRSAHSMLSIIIDWRRQSNCAGSGSLCIDKETP